MTDKPKKTPKQLTTTEALNRINKILSTLSTAERERAIAFLSYKSEGATHKAEPAYAA